MDGIIIPYYMVSVYKSFRQYHAEFYQPDYLLAFVRITYNLLYIQIFQYLPILILDTKNILCRIGYNTGKFHQVILKYQAVYNGISYVQPSFF